MANMRDMELLERAWANLLIELDCVRRLGEEAAANLQELDEKRRVDGEVVNGVIAAYCRCGKKECPDLGKTGHSLRYHLQTAEGATHIPKKRLGEYQSAAENRRLYLKAKSDIRKYRSVCEGVYRVLGYVSKKRDFDSYLLTFT